ncbi:MAG: tyrosine-type recombinase/integrase [Flavobacteriia bacterium]|nr:tyrosine-type recombinase/integrase [Flavobacteriia bacterium]
MNALGYLEKYIHYIQSEKRYSGHTITAYQSDVNYFIDFLNITTSNDLCNVQKDQVRSWLLHLHNQSFEAKTINRKIISLRRFFNFLESEFNLKQNPFSRVNALKSKKRIPVFVKEEDLTLEKIHTLFNQDFNGQRDKIMFELFYQCGIRLSELIELKINDIEKYQIKVLGKRNKERIIPISENFYKEIQNFIKLNFNIIKDNFHLLTLFNGNKLYPKFVYRKINYYLSVVTNVERKSPHVLRHTFATHMLNNGAGLETLKELLGHADLTATQVYTHSSFAGLSKIYSSAHPRGHKNK